MGDPWDFLDDKNWLGGGYDLAIKLGRRNDVGATERALGAIRTVWDRDRGGSRSTSGSPG